MIKTDNIDEYASLKAIEVYCHVHRENDCEDCKIKAICDCMPISPQNFPIIYKETKDDE